MRERVIGPINFLAAGIIGFGVGSIATTLLDRTIYDLQPITQKSSRLAKLALVEVQEPVSVSEFIPVFDEVFSSLEKGGLKINIPVDPLSIELERFEASFERETVFNLRYKLVKSNLPDNHLMRAIDIKFYDFGREQPVTYFQIFDEEASSPNLEDFTPEKWQALGRVLTRGYNEFAERRNGRIDLRNDYEPRSQLAIPSPTTIYRSKGLKST